MPRIIPIFIMNRGCPNRCIFCNEKIAAGDHPSPFSGDVLNRMMLNHLRGRRQQRASSQSSARETRADTVQMAFYGGNFTGLAIDEQKAWLELAKPFIDQGMIDSIRISSRPDAIHPEQMAFLRAFHVGTVEIGAQSLVDEVLLASRRGHSAAAVSEAVRVLKTAGFEIGLHLMAGLPGDNRERFAATVEAAVAMAPDMVRVHPTLVLRDTPLAEMFLRGDYEPLTMDQALECCKYAVRRFTEACIPVIRLGLQTTREMEQPGAVVAGPFHPAFGALVEASAFLDRASAMLKGRDVHNRWVTFYIPPEKESAFRGNKNANLRILRERFHLAGITVKRAAVFRMSLS